MIAPGVLLSDRYRLTSRIAIGGMGEVWAAQDTRLGRTVAVKILRAEFTGDPEFVDRFRAEARMTASLNHPGIAAIYDYGETDLAVGTGPDGRPHSTAYLVMELVAGEPLSAVLPRVRRLSPSRTLDVVEQTGRALHAAHSRNLVHRDVKPGNLLITPNGQVKVTDFGIAKVAHQAPVTRTGMVMGTAHYISPEQAAGEEAVPASDIYSLGVVAYECLAGRLPFLADTTVGMAMAHVRDEPPPLPSDVPAPIAALVGHMMVKDPQRRFADGAALCAGIAQIRASARAGTATRSTGSAPATRTFARPPAAAATRVDAPSPSRTAPSRTARPIPRTATPSPAAGVSAAPRARPTIAPPRMPPPPVRPAPRRTALATLLALLVLLLAVLAVITVDLRLVGGAAVDHVRAVAAAAGAGTRS